MSQNAPPQDSPQEITRRVENIARLGTVVEVRHSKPARCRIKMGDNTSDWLPWMAGRAAGNKGSKWWPPVVGEQCLVLAPGGDLSQGLAMLGAYSNSMDAPSDGAGVERTQWSEKDFSEYRDSAHTTHTERTIVFEVGAGCRIAMGTDSITLKVGGDCSITLSPNGIALIGGGATLQIGPDKIASSVDVVAKGVSVVRHMHGGVRSGLDSTGVPK